LWAKGATQNGTVLRRPLRQLLWEGKREEVRHKK